MAGRPKEKYQPGELRRVREKLGSLTKDEAKKMSEILGGEIGIEKTDQNINTRYQELQKKQRRKGEDKWLDYRPEKNFHKIEYKGISRIRYSYLERIKLYILASHPDHGVKTVKQTLSSLLDIFSKQKNYLNPDLIRNSNYHFLRSIKTLVSSTRFISKNIKKKYLAREKNPFYWIIIDTICSWNIEGIQEEIYRLKQQSKNITLDSALPLLQLIYRPIIRLSKLNSKEDVAPAITYAYKLSVEGLHKRDLQMDRLRKSYSLALGEINNVLQKIKYSLYPLLLMSVSSKAYDYKTMFKFKSHDILEFLELRTSDLVHRNNINQTASKEDRSEETETDLEKEIIDDHDETDILEDISLHQGILFLNRLFPEAGWDSLNNNPDMYPYFKSVLNLPDEISLISPKDSLQQIVILLAVLKDMFYGFSNIEYGFFFDEKEMVIELGGIMKPLIKNWYLFIDDLILKNYLEPLYEYCRDLERNTDFPKTDYAKRIASDILWVKKKYICPNISLHLPKVLQPRISISTPKMYREIDHLKSILERMVLEIYSRGDIAVETIRNSREESQFEIENLISGRIKLLLKGENKKLTNAELILCTYKVTSVLRHLVYTSGSGGDESRINGLFRTENIRGDKPIYSVSSIDTFFKLNNKEKNISTDPEKDTMTTDLITGFFGAKQFPGYLQQYIANYKETLTNFSLIYINIKGYNANRTQKAISQIENAGTAVSDSIRLLKDIPFRIAGDHLYILLPESNYEAALKVGRRILANPLSSNELFIGISEYKPGADKDSMMKILENTISKQIPNPGITYFDISNEKYLQI